MTGTKQKKTLSLTSTIKLHLQGSVLVEGADEKEEGKEEEEMGTVTSWQQTLSEQRCKQPIP